ncbi:MAG: helix-turn-helix domain-containing protein, partial [Clostridia bacterium]|nr:helix-turn-helix domain-containing protein [Clostridia bacterium]
MQAVVRAVALLDRLADAPTPPSVGELSEIVGLARPTVHRL